MNEVEKQKIAFFREIIFSIDNNELEKAKQYLLKVPKEEYCSFFYNRITEKELAKDIKEKYLDTGRYALENEEYELAYDYLTAGLYLSNNPLFYYYLGKLFYKLNKLSKAMGYFNKYRNVGSLKLNKCYFYLFLISKRKKLSGSGEYLGKFKDIDRFLDITFKTRNPNKKHNRRKKDKIETIKEIENDYSFYEEDKEEADDTIAYEDLDLKNKLEFIKNLLLLKKEKEANKLLRNLKAETKEEKQLVKQLENNKRIYLNKSK